MRNLKRVLSLALALVMVLGMMVITTSAADFTDAEEITNIEAVEVLAELGIVQGSNGAFDPTGTFTREAAAKLLTYMLIGGDMAEKLAGTDVFTDVAADRWSAKYIGYCANLGYITGNGDGTFNPDGELTDIALGKLVLCAIGKDATKYTGANWASAVTVDMLDTGLVKNVTGAAISREDACAMILAAMKYSETPDVYEVRYTENSKTTYTRVGEFDTLLDAALYASVLGGYTEETTGTGDSAVTTGEGYYTAKAAATDTLLKEVYDVTYDDETATDKFGRPGIRYTDIKTAGKKVNLFYANEADYVVDVTSTRNGANTLAKIAEGLNLKVAGNATYAVGDTVEIYTDKDGNITAAVCLHTDLAKVVKVAKTTDEDAKYTYDVTVKVDNNNRTYTDKELEGFDVETMVKGTYVTIIENKTVDPDYAVVALADSITGKQTATGTGYIKVDGEKKTLTGAWAIDPLNYTSTFNFYVDGKGYVIGYEEVEAAKEAINVFYVTASNFDKGDTFGADKAQLAVTYLDGSEEILDMEITVDEGVKYVDVNGEKALAKDVANPTGFYKYTLNDEGEVASITAVGYASNNAEDTFVQLRKGNSVTFTEGKAIVKWVLRNFYANEDTTVTTITKKGVSTITGYENFLGKAFTESKAEGKVVDVLMQYDGDVVEAVYVIGDSFTPVAEDAVVGVYIETGDTTYDAAKAKYYTEVVYNVAGENVTYTIEGQSVAKTYQGLAEITVTNGVAKLAAADSVTADKAVTKVTDSYIVTEDGIQYLASDVVIYDVTNVAKNGVVVDDEVVVNDIISYTTKTVAGQTVVSAIYVTYAAQEDGKLAIDLSSAAGQAYFTDVLGCNSAELDNIDTTNPGSYVVYQYTRPADFDSFLLKVESGSNTAENEWTTDNVWNPEHSGPCGFLYYATDDNDYESFTFTIEIDEAVVMSGAFEFTK